VYGANAPIRRGECPEGGQARRKEFEYAIANGLVYAPGMHPWSVYRGDPELKHLEWLIEMAREQGIPIVSCSQLHKAYGDSIGGGM